MSYPESNTPAQITFATASRSRDPKPIFTESGDLWVQIGICPKVGAPYFVISEPENRTK